VADLIGQQIGSYKIIDKLGVGGMAIVYRAFDSKLNREVAMKVIKGDLSSNSDFIQRFEREARTIAMLSHPHILKVFDYGQVDENVYLIIELMTGGSLADRVRRERMSLETVTQMLDQIGRALDYAHRQGIVHRDLKPQNVLLDPDGNAYLTDFGIAKLLQADSNLTATGMVMGTPAYMSPEQWSGQPVDGRTDIYALGVILYEMLVGAVPFDGDTPFRLMHQHIYEPPRPIKPLRSDLPDGVQTVLNRALSKNRDDRYASALELITEFRNALAGKVAPPADTPQVLDGATVGLPAVKAPTPTTLPSTPPTPPSTPITPIATGNNRRGIFIVGGAATVIVALAAFFVLARPGATGSSTPTLNATNTSAPATTAPVVALAATVTPSLTATRTEPTNTATLAPTVNEQGTLEAFIAATSAAQDRATGIAKTIEARFTQTALARPTNTPLPPTSTVVPPTATLLPPTATPLPPTLVPTLAPTLTSTPTLTPTLLPTNTRVIPVIGGGKNKIAFYSTRRNSNDLYLMNTDGSDVQPITKTEGGSPENGNVNVWPDGSKIIFASNRSGDYQIWTVNVDGSNPQQLTKGNPMNLNPVPSPDGKRIAFVSTRDGGDYELYVMNADGTNQTRLTFSKGFDTEPTWTADSKTLMFMSGRTGTFQIFVINADGTKERRLFASRFKESSPALSPDGKTLAWSSDRTGSREIFVMNVEKENQTPIQLTKTKAGTLNGWPNWSPDGKFLTFTSNRDGNTEVYIIGVDGKNETHLEGSPAADGDAGAKWLP
jgi:serine/threonine protein kinase/Tol biopolymer transport system component